jgi:L-threonine kinase
MVTVRVPGTCGELIQGTINGQDFLVTFPVEVYTEVTVELNENSHEIINPQGLTKVVAAVGETLKYLGLPLMGGSVAVNSEIPHGKGMASSSADITGAIMATAIAIGTAITPEEIAKIALSIEPTDGIMFPGIVLFDHRQGKVFQSLGEVSGLDVTILDLGGAIDTKEFNGQGDLPLKNRVKEGAITRALKILQKGLQKGDLSLVGQAATISAIAHQDILYKDCLDLIVKLANHNGAYGVNIAHSGTVVGVLGISGPKAYNLVKSLEEHLGRKIPVTSTKICSGGGDVLINDRGESIWRKYTTSMEGTFGLKEKNMA